MLQRVLIGCCLVLCLCAQTFAQSSASQEKFLRGVDAYARGNYAEAANLWLVESYEGSSDAQFNLGVLYIEGKGVAQNRNEALFWFTRAAEAGHVEAQYNLGHLYFEDKENSESVAIAVAWWRKAAEQGFTIAQYNFGRALFYGVGIEKNIEQARFWMEQSAFGGEEVAKNFLQEHAAALTDKTLEELPQSSSIEQVTADVGSEEQPDEIEVIEVTEESQPVEEQVAQEIEPEVEQQVQSDAQDQDSKPLSDEGSDFISESGNELVQVNENVYHVLVKQNGELVYSRFNSRAPVITTLEARILLRVVAQVDGWMQVQKPGGFTAWVAASDVTISQDFAKVNRPGTSLLADFTDQSSSNQIGELQENEQLLVLLRAGEWVQVLAPEQISGWIKEASVTSVSANESEIATIWQAQRLDTKILALAPNKNTAAIEPVVEQPAEKEVSQTSEQEQKAEQEKLEELTIDEFVAQYQDEFEINTLPSEISKSLPQHSAQIQRINRSGVQLLSSPNMFDDPLFNITKGTLVHVGDVEDDWARVSIPGGLPVWVRIENVDLDKATAVINKDGVTMSPNPKIFAQRDELGQFNQGMRLEILQVEEPWIRLLAPQSTSAWIALKDMDTVEETEELNREWVKQKLKLHQSLAKYEVPAEVQEIVIEQTEIEEQSEQVVVEQTVVAQPEPQVEPQPAPQPESQPEPVQHVPTVNDFSLADSENSDHSAQSFNSNRPGLKSSGYNNDNSWLFAQPLSRVTFQLFSIKDRDKALELFRELNGDGQFFSTVSREIRWHYILLGSFSDAESAEAFRGQLPRWARKAEIKSFSKLQSKRCEKLDQLQSFESRDLAQRCN